MLLMVSVKWKKKKKKTMMLIEKKTAPFNGGLTTMVTFKELYIP